MTRRDFIGRAARAGAGLALAGCTTGVRSGAVRPEPAFMWSALLHLGINSWADGPLSHWGGVKRGDRDEYVMRLREAQPCLRTTDAEWRFCVDGMAKAGMNQVIIDMAEGIRYESHPELAVEGSWPIEKFRRELDYIRALGMEPIPKMNFSTAHDTWLKDYHRMVSTPTYYRVCADLLREVYEIFDKPRLFHLGYDEETAEHQALYQFAVIRQGELWWHDFLWFHDQVRRLGARTWIWADKIWHHRADLERRMPREVLMSNWYYGEEFDLAKLTNEFTRNRVRAYAWLDAAGFDQVPTGSNCGFRTKTNLRSFEETVANCSKIISPTHLKGFCMASWSRQVPEYHAQNAHAIASCAAAKAIYASQVASGAAGS